MSIKVMSAVWDMPLSAKDKLILLALADCANEQGLAWPSINTIARKCGCDPRTVQRNLRNLEKTGIISREEVVGKGCKYRFDLRQIATPDKMSPATNRPKTGDKLPPKPSRTVNNKKHKHAIPTNWWPKEFGKNTKSRRIVDSWSEDDLAEQVERFTAHHTKVGSEWECWQSAWSTWVLNSKNFKPRQAPAQHQRGGSLADIGNEVRQLYGY